MSGQFGTQVDVMESSARHVQSVNEQIQGRLKTLQGQLATLPAEWRGTSSMEFQRLMIRWDEDARRINESLRVIGEAVRASGVGYGATDDDNRVAFSGLAGGAPGGGPTAGPTGGASSGGSISSALG